MTRDRAFKLLNKKIKIKNLIKHSLAVEAVMRDLADYFNEDREKWGIAGLLHDIDYEETKNEPFKHSLIGAEFLEKLDLEKDIVEAVKVHNEIHNFPRKTKLARALFCADPITGLIVAASLVLPSKKLTDLTVENILNRFKEKAFAKGANRSVILACSEIGLNLEEFVRISLMAMQRIAKDLDL